MPVRSTLSSKDTDGRKKSLRAVMKHKNLGALMKEALSSPVGSTQRKRAQQMLAVMRKSGVLDGQGGPGTGSAMYITPAITPLSDRFVFLRGAPPLAPQGMRFDGQGGPGFLSNFGVSAPAAPAPSSQTPTPGAPSAPSFLSKFGVPGSTPPTVRPRVPSTPFASGLFNVAGASTLTPPAQQGSYSDYVANEANRSTALSPSVQGNYNTSTPTPTNVATPIETQAPAYTYAANNAGSSTPLFPSGGTPLTGGSTGGTPGTGGATGPSTYSNLRQAAGAAVAQNMGSGLFAYEQAIRSLSPEFANMPSESLPYGSALVNQIDKLGDTLKKEYKIDELYNRMATLSEGSNTIQDDLASYVRGKDEYLNNVEQLIQEAEGRLADADTSNPVVAAQGKQYLDYLYTIKGRQNQRYADFLTGSVNLYQKKLEQATNNYTRALDSYEKELKMKSELTLSEFNTYMTALQGMYQEIADAPKKALEIQYMKTQIAAAKAQMARDAVGTYGSGSFLDNASKIKNTFQTKDGTLDPSINDLRGAIDNAMQQKGITSADAAKSFVWIMNSGLTALKSNPEAYNKEAERYLGLLSNYARNPIPGAAIDKSWIAANLGGEIQQTMRQNILSDADSLATLQTATRELISPERRGFLNLRKGKTPTRDKFVNDYKDKLNPDFLDYLYTDFEDYNKDPNSQQFLGKIFSPAVLKVNANGEYTGEQEGIAKRKDYKQLTPEELADTVTSRYVGRLIGGY